jgi:hypothetical protein
VAPSKQDVIALVLSLSLSRGLRLDIPQKETGEGMLMVFCLSMHLTDRLLAIWLEIKLSYRLTANLDGSRRQTEIVAAMQNHRVFDSKDLHPKTPKFAMPCQKLFTVIRQTNILTLGYSSWKAIYLSEDRDSYGDEDLIVEWLSANQVLGLSRWAGRYGTAEELKSDIEKVDVVLRLGKIHSQRKGWEDNKLCRYPVDRGLR